MKKMEGKVIIVTGGGKGIGFGIATAFAKEGANLVLTGRTVERLQNAKDKLEKEYGIKVLSIAADGGKEDDVKRAVAETIKEFGKIDCIINNAQASASGVMLKDHTKADFDLAINTGLYGAFFYMRECYPYLKETKGCVINFASGAGLAGRPGQSSYAAAKEGIRGLTRVAATEWGPDGIRANVVCPLAMTEQLAAWKESYPELYDATIKNIPLQRFADPEKDIGRICVFLASDDAAYISGETITAQGGSGLRP
ncbi:MAG: SDR family oxidoreductase [Methanocorpusculum sp.]|nr:SDR family oxidoreductase [Methanocorpusculum sp.]